MTNLTLRARNFRVIERLDWSPRGVCLLSGANGAGKSTVLDALSFLRALFELGHEAGFARVGARYFRSIATPESEPVIFDLEVGDIRWKLRFPMATAGIKDTFGEELYHGERLVLRAAMFQQQWFLGNDPHPLDETRCCAKVVWDRGDAVWMKPLVDLLGGIHIHKAYELSRVRRSQPMTPRQRLLESSGENLWSVLLGWKGSTIRSGGRFEWVMSETRKAFPGLFFMLEQDGSGFPVLYPPGASGPEHGLPPERAADGLLTALLHLTAVAGARPGAVLAFDELENQLHPHAIRSLMSSIRQRADEQGLTVILTTHSPVVMNEFRDNLEQVFVLDRSDSKRPLPVAMTDLHSEEWLAQAKLGTLYDRLAFGAPEDTVPQS